RLYGSCGLWILYSGSVVEFAICFFFQAEDGIRDWSVTGVQTCALPISGHLVEVDALVALADAVADDLVPLTGEVEVHAVRQVAEIGRASCRERVKSSVVAVSLKKRRRGRDEDSGGREQRDKRRGERKVQ